MTQRANLSELGSGHSLSVCWVVPGCLLNVCGFRLFSFFFNFKISLYILLRKSDLSVDNLAGFYILLHWWTPLACTWKLEEEVLSLAVGLIFTFEAFFFALFSWCLFPFFVGTLFLTCNQQIIAGLLTWNFGIMFLMINSFRRVRLLHQFYLSLKTLLQ